MNEKIEKVGNYLLIALMKVVVVLVMLVAGLVLLNLAASFDEATASIISEASSSHIEEPKGWHPPMLL